MKMYKYIGSSMCMLMVAFSAQSESLSSTSFQYDGGTLGYLERNEVYSAWNAKNPKAVQKPGMKVMFFGRAQGCDSAAKDGPVTDVGNPNFEQAQELTGIPLAKESKGQRWTPSANMEQCEASARKQIGDSFVHVNDDPKIGGIGIYTSTGSEKKGEQYFFQPIGAEGKDGMGVNGGIEGTFVTFLFDWEAGNTIRPWAGDAKTDEKRKAIFKTVQSISVATVGDGVISRTAEPIQAKQQFIVALVNHACWQAKEEKNRCKLKYLFNMAVYRTAIKDWGDVKWFQNAGVFNDEAQGGIAIVHGPIGRKGQETKAQGTDLGIYTSQGEPSQHEVFGEKEFRIQVTFAQLKNAMKLALAKTLKKPVAKISTDDLVAYYTGKWDDPNEWMVMSTNTSQEIHNPHSDVHAHIGGAVHSLSLRAVSTK